MGVQSFWTTCITLILIMCGIRCSPSADGELEFCNIIHSLAPAEVQPLNFVYGEDINMNCSAHNIQWESEWGPLNSSFMHFRISSSVVPQPETIQTIVDDMTIALHIAGDVTAKSNLTGAHFSCFVSNGEHDDCMIYNNIIGFQIWHPPVEPDLHCEHDGYSEMTCEWGPTDGFTWWRKSWRGRESCETGYCAGDVFSRTDTATFTRPRIDAPASCEFDTPEDHTRWCPFYLHEEYSMTIETVTLGLQVDFPELTLISNFSITTDAHILRLDPLTVNVTEINSRHVVVRYEHTGDSRDARTRFNPIIYNLTLYDEKGAMISYDDSLRSGLLDGPSFTHTVADLIPVTVYTVKVSARAEQGGFWSHTQDVATHTFTTASEAPGAPPGVIVGGFRVERPVAGTVSETVVTVFWQEVPVELQYGVMKSYLLQYFCDNEEGNLTMPIKEFSADITKCDLTADHMHVLISADNDAGVSESACITVPQQGENVNAILPDGDVDEEGTLTLSWLSVDRNDTAGWMLMWCEGNYAERHCSKESQPLSVTLEPNITTYTVSPADQVGNVYAVAPLYHNKTNSTGLQGGYSTPWVCLYDINAVPGFVQDGELFVRSSTEILVTWRHLVCDNDNHARIISYQISYDPVLAYGTLMKVPVNLRTPDLLNVSLTDLLPDTGYNITIIATSNGGQTSSTTQRVNTKVSPGFPVWAIVLITCGVVIAIVILIIAIHRIRDYMTKGIEIVVPEPDFKEKLPVEHTEQFDYPPGILSDDTNENDSVTSGYNSEENAAYQRSPGEHRKSYLDSDENSNSGYSAIANGYSRVGPRSESGHGAGDSSDVADDQSSVAAIDGSSGQSTESRNSCRSPESNPGTTGLYANGCIVNVSSDAQHDRPGGYMPFNIIAKQVGNTVATEVESQEVRCPVRNPTSAPHSAQQTNIRPPNPYVPISSIQNATEETAIPQGNTSIATSENSLSQPVTCESVQVDINNSSRCDSRGNTTNAMNVMVRVVSPPVATPSSPHGYTAHGNIPNSIPMKSIGVTAMSSTSYTPNGSLTMQM